MSAGMTLLLALLPLAGTALGWLFITARSTVTYDITAMVFREAKDSGVLPEIKAFENIAVTRVELTNHAIKHLEDVEVFLDFVGEKWLAVVEQTTTVSKEAVLFQFKDGTLRTTIKEMPRGEKVKINLLHRGGSGYYDMLRGGGNRFRLMRAIEYRWKRLIYFTVGLSAGLVAMLIVTALPLLKPLTVEDLRVMTEKQR